MPPSEPISASSYEAVPYKSFPFMQTHPQRLATTAWLFGLATPNIETCRVLELACGSGGNLLPMAEQLPRATFVGIDLSASAIAEAQRISEQLGMQNVSFHARDLRDCGAELGQFDYIIAHGLYSWVPAEVQAKLLAICSRHLSPTGVVYVSYNTLPGWGVRGGIRDALRYRCRQITDPAERVRQGRALVEMMAQAAAAAKSPHSASLAEELRWLTTNEDYYLLHEFFEDENHPLYFHQFVERADGVGLKYLCEAELAGATPNNYAPGLDDQLRILSLDRIEREQYLDFARQRMFRQTLLCHRDVPLADQPNPESLRDLFIASDVAVEEVAQDGSGRTRFRRGGSYLTTDDRPFQNVFMALQRHWPTPLTFAELVNQAQELAEQSGLADLESNLAKRLLQAFSTKLIDLFVAPPRVASAVNATPLASPLARFHAASSATVPSLLHGLTRLDGFQQFLLPLLDGARDRDALASILLEQSAGELQIVDGNGVPLQTPDQIRQVLGQLVERTCEHFLQQGLLAAA